MFEGRMLVLTGISDADGYLRSGTVVTMYDGSKFTTDGTQYITSGLASPELADRASLIAPGDDVPAVIYFHAGYKFPLPPITTLISYGFYPGNHIYPTM